MSYNPTEATPRRVVLAILGQHRNGWMISFHHASGAIARAVADGRISAQEIMNYPPEEYPEEMSAHLARTAGLLWHNDNPDGDTMDVDAEDIAVSVAAIRAIVEGDAGIQQGTWYFEEEDQLASEGTTIEALCLAMRLNSVPEAGQLIVDADNWLLGHI